MAGKWNALFERAVAGLAKAAKSLPVIEVKENITALVAVDSDGLPRTLRQVAAGRGDE